MVDMPLLKFTTVCIGPLLNADYASTAWLILQRSEQYMSERGSIPIALSPTAKYCKQWRKAKRSVGGCVNQIREKIRML